MPAVGWQRGTGQRLCCTGSSQPPNALLTESMFTFLFPPQLTIPQPLPSSGSFVQYSHPQHETKLLLWLTFELGTASTALSNPCPVLRLVTGKLALVCGVGVSCRAHEGGGFPGGVTQESRLGSPRWVPVPRVLTARPPPVSDRQRAVPGRDGRPAHRRGVPAAVVQRHQQHGHPGLRLLANLG